MRIFKSILVALLTLLFISAFFTGQIPTFNYLKAARISHAVINFPLGSSKAQVATFLKNEDLEYGYVDGKDLDFSSDMDDNGYTSADLSGYTHAIIRNVSFGFPISCDVEYCFFFDKKGKLIKATAEKTLTGL